MRYLAAALAVFGMLAALPAQAHVFRYFDTVSVLLHMEPGDDPIAREPAQLFFYFNDKAGKFQVSRCDCRVKITEGDRTVYDAPLTGEAKSYGEDVRLVNFTFPAKDVYKVELSAKEPHYDPFTMSYDVRIDKESELPAAPAGDGGQPPWGWVAGAGGAILIGIIVGLVIKRKKP